MFSRMVFVAVATLAATVSTPAEARDFRVDEIPNGNKRGCYNCHRDGGGSTFTDFGSDARTSLEGDTVASEKHVNWQKFYQRDSDGDGYTNGQELGDPDGLWTPGMPDPAVPVTNPGDAKSFPKPICNNGKLDPGESCEGAQLSKSDCSAVGAGTGTLACTATCKFDYAGCSMPPDSSDDGDGETGFSDDSCASAPGRSRAGGIGLVVALVAAASLGVRRANQQTVAERARRR